MKVIIGFGCLYASNGLPGGGVCAEMFADVKNSRRNVAMRNMRTIIIDRDERNGASTFYQTGERRKACLVAGCTCYRGRFRRRSSYGLFKAAADLAHVRRCPE